MAPGDLTEVLCDPITLSSATLEDGTVAYQTLELLTEAMRCGARRAGEQLSRAIASGGRRVSENGGGSTAVTRADPRTLTSGELSEIRKRVQRGEKIRF